MPIKGLTDRDGGLSDGMIRIATLFKGEEQRDHRKPSGEIVKIMGRDLNYFRVDFEPEYEWARETWEELYTAQPVQFEPVYIAAQTVEEVLDSWWMEDWNTSGTLLHRCDTETQVAHWQPGANAYSFSPIACAGTQCGCKQTARITLIFPKLWEALGIPCVVTLTTHSKHDILTLRGHLALIQKMYGTIAGVPFVFGRAPREISVPNEKQPGKRIKTTKSLLYIRVTSNFTRTQLLPALSGTPSISPRVDAETGELEPGETPLALGAGDQEHSGDEPPAIDNTLSGNALFDCGQLLVLPIRKNSFQYVAKTDQGVNLVMFNRDVFRASGFFDQATLDSWVEDVPTNGRQISLLPPIHLEARQTEKGWDVVRLVPVAELPPPDLHKIPS